MFCLQAVKRGHKQIVKFLLEYGANFSAQNNSGFSALTYAKMLRLTEIEDIITEFITRQKIIAFYDEEVARQQDIYLILYCSWHCHIILQLIKNENLSLILPFQEIIIHVLLMFNQLIELYINLLMLNTVKELLIN